MININECNNNDNGFKSNENTQDIYKYIKDKINTKMESLKGTIESQNAEIKSLKGKIESQNAEMESLKGIEEFQNAEIKSLKHIRIIIIEISLTFKKDTLFQKCISKCKVNIFILINFYSF